MRTRSPRVLGERRAAGGAGHSGLESVLTPVSTANDPGAGVAGAADGRLWGDKTSCWASQQKRGEKEAQVARPAWGGAAQPLLLRPQPPGTDRCQEAPQAGVALCQARAGVGQRPSHETFVSICWALSPEPLSL